MQTPGSLQQRTVTIRVDQRLSLRSEQMFLSVYESLKNITLIFHQEEMEELAKVERPGTETASLSLFRLNIS